MNTLDRALQQQRRTLDEAFADYDPAAATQRLVSRIVQEGLTAALARSGPVPPPTGGTALTDTTTDQHRAAAELERLCRHVIGRPNTGQLLTGFVNERVPAGAVVFSCLLYLTGRSEPAAFWWRFAAGADEDEAVRFLMLHHRVQGEPRDEQRWAASIPAALPSTATDTHPADTASRPAKDTERYVVRAEPGIEEVEDPDFGEVCLPRTWLPTRMMLAGGTC
ncbi:hypothetical protein ACIRL2_46000 [Embleya sp. NPDC127516]|uniref:hypothetical protein n=1 Tax=Embleya sp. NPDC127516 TaxID=3363990 RepID=UPI003821E9D2